MRRTQRIGLAQTMGLLALGGVATAAGSFDLAARLSGAQEVSEVITDASGLVTARFAPDLSSVQVELNVRGTDTEVVAAHFHCAVAGDNGPIAFGLFQPGPCPFDGARSRCTLTNDDLTDVANACESGVGRPVSNIAALAFAMREGLIYANVHTVEHPAGEIRGQMIASDLPPRDRRERRGDGDD